MSFPGPERDAYIRDRVHEAYVSLTVDEICVLQLHHCERLTIPEIAEFLGRPSDAVEMNLQQACAEFEKRLKVPSDWLQGLGVGEVLIRYLASASEEEAERSGRRVWYHLEKEMKEYDLEFRSLYRNGPEDAHGLRDLQVLAAIDDLGGKSSFQKISAIVSGWSSTDVESRFVHAALNRLQDRKLITSDFPDLAEPNDAPKRLFKMTPAGQSKLSRVPKQALARVKGEEWDDTDDSAWRAPF